MVCRERKCNRNPCKKYDSENYRTNFTWVVKQHNSVLDSGFSGLRNTHLIWYVRCEWMKSVKIILAEYGGKTSLQNAGCLPLGASWPHSMCTRRFAGRIYWSDRMCAGMLPCSFQWMVNRHHQWPHKLDHVQTKNRSLGAQKKNRKDAIKFEFDFFFLIK